MTRTSPTPRFAALLMGALIALSAGAASAETWSILPFGTRGVDANATETFREILQNELSTRTGDSFVSGKMACGDIPCAKKAGEDVGAQVVVFGSLSSLGSKIIVTATVVDAATGNVASNQRISINRVEDLEIAAERMASAITRGTNTDETAELGTITEQEVAPSRRREGKSGLGLRVASLFPVGSGYAETGGVGMDLTYWYETDNFAIEPRIGFRFNSENKEKDSFFEMPVDVGAYYILTKDDFAPFIGGGAGLRYIADERVDTVHSATVIATSTEVPRNDSAFGFGAFARAGVLLFRTYTLRVALTADYNITFVKLHGESTPQSFTTGIGVYF